MNAVQFGRWFSERRRAGGWPSQRLLAEAARQQSTLCQAGISEDFLSRLEAGHLAYPFRGTVRRRILLLAWLLCQTPRDLRAYMKAAGLNDCSDEERNQLHRLSEHLTTRQTPPPILLAARPNHLQGREAEIEQILNLLNNSTTHTLALTGMPGVGKSALAHEALHRLAAAENEHPRQFPDGIATFTCTGRQGTRGLISLLGEITTLFTTTLQPARSHTRKEQRCTHPADHTSHPSSNTRDSEADLASAIDRARMALANKRALILLDNLDPTFPLRQALDVLLTQNPYAQHETGPENRQKQHVILTTSQFIPAPALTSARLHIQPLQEAAALALLTELLGYELNEAEYVSASQACASIGYLPLAIESMATAVQAKGIPLLLVTAHLCTHPLRYLMDNEKEIVAEMEKALAALEQDRRTDYLLLAALGLPTFNLPTATAIFSTQRLSLPDREPVRHTTAHLAGTAAILGQFVRLSLLERLPDEPVSQPHNTASTQLNAQTRHAFSNGVSFNGTSTPASTTVHSPHLLVETPETRSIDDISYRLHPLLYHYAHSIVHTLPPERLELAQHNLLTYVHSAQN